MSGDMTGSQPFACRQVDNTSVLRPERAWVCDLQLLQHGHIVKKPGPNTRRVHERGIYREVQVYVPPPAATRNDEPQVSAHGGHSNPILLRSSTSSYSSLVRANRNVERKDGTAAGDEDLEKTLCRVRVEFFVGGYVHSAPEPMKPERDCAPVVVHLGGS